MLIDARHPEETRVAVLKGNRIEEFDFESAEHKQIKGNIYLAKVTRVEPSLQAAFVDFGGNRHGFLAFGEIHPDYYQIPQADREALLAEEAAHAEEEAALRADEDDDDEDLEADYGDDEISHVEEVDAGSEEVSTIEDGRVENGDEEPAGDDEAEDEQDTEIVVDEEGEPAQRGRRGRGRRQGRGQSRAKEMDELKAKRQALRRRYKIQDVIQRRQVLLVQVVKEERGNKGAALTTYLSLAGRYCVLMPNSGHGGGISRKISSAADRKRLKRSSASSACRVDGA
jgi:ribonuclease E